MCAVLRGNAGGGSDRGPPTDRSGEPVSPHARPGSAALRTGRLGGCGPGPFPRRRILLRGRETRAAGRHPGETSAWLAGLRSGTGGPSGRTGPLPERSRGLRAPMGPALVESRGPWGRSPPCRRPSSESANGSPSGPRGRRAAIRAGRDREAANESGCAKGPGTARVRRLAVRFAVQGRDPRAGEVALGTGGVRIRARGFAPPPAAGRRGSTQAQDGSEKHGACSLARARDHAGRVGGLVIRIR